MSVPEIPAFNNLPLFGEGRDAQPHKSTYVIYGVALPIALATIALGMVTYLGYRPLGPLLTDHTYRLVVAGGLMGGGALAILAIFLRYQRSVGIESIDRVVRLMPHRVEIKEGDTVKTRILTPSGLKQEYFLRLNEKEAFMLPSLKDPVVYVHVRNGYYYKKKESDVRMEVSGNKENQSYVESCRQTGLVISLLDEGLLADRDKMGPGKARLIDIEKDLVSRLHAGESVQFAGAFVVHHRRGIYTIENTPENTILMDVHTLLGREPYLNREAKKPDLKRDLLPLLKDEQEILFKGKYYVHVCDGYYFERSLDYCSPRLVPYSDVLEQAAPLGRKLKQVDLKRDLIPRMEEGEWIDFKGAYYLHIERGMWVKSDSPIGKQVSLCTLLKREKKHKLAQLPTWEQIWPLIDELGPNQCIYFSKDNTVQVYANKQPTLQVKMAELDEPTIEITDKKGCLKKSLGLCMRPELAPKPNSIIFMKPYSGREAHYHSVSLEALKGKCRPPKSDHFPYEREDKERDEERIAQANSDWGIEEEFFDPPDGHVHFDIDK